MASSWSKKFIIRWKFNLFTFLKILREHSPIHDGPYPIGFVIHGNWYAYKKVRQWGTLRRSWRLGQDGISVNAKGDGLTIRNKIDGVAFLQNRGYETHDFQMPPMPNVYDHPAMMVSPGFFTKSRKGFKVDKHKGFVKEAVDEFMFHSKGLKVAWGSHAMAPLGYEGVE